MKSTLTVIDALDTLVVDATSLAQLFRRFHWEVRGPQFFQLHERFEALYEEWSEKADDFAERVLQLGGRPTATLEAVITKSAIKDDGRALDSRAMVSVAVSELERAIVHLESAAEAAEASGDRVSADLATEVLAEQQKHVWMLKAWLD